MSFRIASTQRNASFVTPGESYVILASSDALRKHLSDSYWCESMEQVCGGKLPGVAVRYTGENLVFLQFRPNVLSPAGYRYPLYMSIPIEFMVPAGASTVSVAGTEAGHHGSFVSATASSFVSNSSEEGGNNSVSGGSGGTNHNTNNTNNSTGASGSGGASGSSGGGSGGGGGTAALPKLCVVCGRYNVPGMIARTHGWKCKDCKGKKSLERLRNEAVKLQAVLRAAE